MTRQWPLCGIMPLMVLALPASSCGNAEDPPPKTATTTRSAPVQIAFTSDRDGSLEIHVMNADGSTRSALPTTRRRISSPSWSTQ